MATNKKLSLSDRFGIMKPSKTAMEEDTYEAADSFRDEYIKIKMSRQPTTTDCFSSSMLITSDDDELDLKMEDSWKEHFKTCLKENTYSKKDHMINADQNDNIAKALKTTRTEYGEQHGYWKENCCPNQTLDLFKAAENVGNLFKADIPEERERSDIAATRVLGNTKGKNLNKGQMQEHCEIISKSKTCVLEDTKQVNIKDEMIVSFSTPAKQKRLSDQGSEESYVSPLDAVYETKLAENSSVLFQKDKLICDLRTRFTNKPLKQPRVYPCQNDGSTDQGDIRGNSSVSKNGFEQEISPTSPFFNNPFTSDTSNCPQERVTSTQNLSHDVMERDLGMKRNSPSAFSSSETSNYNVTLSHGYTSNSQGNVSELELLERTLNVPSGYYAKKICKNTYKPPERSQPMERSFKSMAPGLYREGHVGHSNHKEKCFEGSPGKEELFQTLLQQCSALVHTAEDHNALEAVISLISQQAGGHLDMNQDARVSNAASTMKSKDIAAESCHSTTIDDSTEIGSSLEEALSLSHKKGDLFEGRTLLKGGVQPRHIPKTYIPKPNREPPFDPRRRPNIDKTNIISLPMPEFCAEIFKLKKAGKLDVSFKPKKSELLEISCSPKNISHDGEGLISDCIVYDDRSISCKFSIEDALIVLGTPIKNENCKKDWMNQMTTNKIYGKLNLNKCGSTSVVNKSSEMEATANMNDITDKEYDHMQQNLCHTRSELMDKTFTNSIIWQEKDFSEGKDKLPSLNTKDEIDYAMESGSRLLTSLNDQVTAGLEQAKVEELEELHITKENMLEMTSTPIRENLKENIHSTDDQNIKSDKVMSSTKENKVFIKDFVQMSPFNMECTKNTEVSVVKTLETSITDAAINEHMEHAVVPVSSHVNLRASISNTTVNAHESVKSSDLNITATCPKREPVFTFKLNKSLGLGNETSMSTQMQCDTIAVSTSEVSGSKHTSHTKEKIIQEKQNPEVQTSIDLSQVQPFCDQSDFQKCELYDPNSPAETIVEEVSMELDSSMEEGEIQSKSDISSDAADTGDEKGCKGLEAVRSKWKETFYTFEKKKEGKSISDELGLRKTLLESKKKDAEDFGGIIENDRSCGISRSQCVQEMRSSDHSCCDIQDSRSKGRCRMSQPMRKGSNDCEDRHRKSHASRRPRSRSPSYSRVQDSGSRSKRKRSNHINNRHKRSRSKDSSDYQDSNSRDRKYRSHSKRKYDRDGALIRCSPSKYEYSRNYSCSNSHRYHYDSCQSRSVRDSDRSSERSPSDDSLKRHTKDRGEETNAMHHRDRKQHHNSLKNQSKEDRFVINLKDSASNRSSAYLSSKCSQSPAFEGDVGKSFRKSRERAFKSTEQIKTNASEMNRLSTAMHTETKTCRDDRQPSQLDWGPDEFVQMRRRSNEWQEWQYSYSHDTFEGNNITDYEGDSVPKMYRGKFANKCYNENIEQS